MGWGGGGGGGGGGGVVVWWRWRWSGVGWKLGWVGLGWERRQLHGNRRTDVTVPCPEPAAPARSPWLSMAPVKGFHKKVTDKALVNRKA